MTPVKAGSAASSRANKLCSPSSRRSLRFQASGSGTDLQVQPTRLSAGGHQTQDVPATALHAGGDDDGGGDPGDPTGEEGPLHRRQRLKKSHWCAAINCTNSREANPELGFFRFPKEQSKCDVWIQLCRRDDLKGERGKGDYCYTNLTLCQQHFEPHMIAQGQKRKKLLHNAEPQIFDVPNCPRREKARRRLIRGEENMKLCQGSSSAQEATTVPHSQGPRAKRVRKKIVLHRVSETEDEGEKYL